MMETVLLQRIESDPAITSMVGNRIFWDERPQAGPLAELPAIVFQNITTSHIGSHDLSPDTLGDSAMQYSVFAKRRSDTKAVANAVRRRLHGWKDLPSGIQGVRASNSVDGYENDTRIFSTVLTFQVWHPS